MLIGQLWANVASHCHWIVNTELELIEILDVEGSESEEDNKKEKDDKLRIELLTLEFTTSISSVRILHLENSPPANYLESTTPPPKPFHI